MEITVNRVHFTDECTIGDLFVDDAFECYSLEDPVRDLSEPNNKIPGMTAIPAGEYEVIIDMSKRFKKLLPLLLDVPGFTGVRIHGGNTAANTQGCILVGQHRGEDSIRNSQAALKPLQDKIQDALDNGESVWITIK